MLAEEELHNHDMELLSLKYLNRTETQSLNRKYFAELKKLCEEQELLNSNIKEVSW